MIINSFNKDYSSCRRDLQLSEDSVGNWRPELNSLSSYPPQPRVSYFAILCLMSVKILQPICIQLSSYTMPGEESMFGVFGWVQPNVVEFSFSSQFFTNSVLICTYPSSNIVKMFFVIESIVYLKGRRFLLMPGTTAIFNANIEVTSCKSSVIILIVKYHTSKFSTTLHNLVRHLVFHNSILQVLEFNTKYLRGSCLCKYCYIQPT